MGRQGLLLGRLRLAAGTWPGRRGWTKTALLAAAYGLTALPLGLAGGLLTPGCTAAPGPALAFALASFIAPSLGEEMLFRVLPIPHASEAVEPRRRRAWAATALILFVLWHPLNAWLLKPWLGPLFYDPLFLLLAGLLGLACTVAYLRTGSLWPPVLIHWLAVLVWNLCLGGPALP
ncbi:MAG: CPBP family glutamic-type intramembrane protease [Pseudomonadota bacterium]|nr:CPBP family glutamic-type intramembrane protease [Pseudomonadota bacterium]